MARLSECDGFDAEQNVLYGMDNYEIFASLLNKLEGDAHTYKAEDVFDWCRGEKAPTSKAIADIIKCAQRYNEWVEQQEPGIATAVDIERFTKLAESDRKSWVEQTAKGEPPRGR